MARKQNPAFDGKVIHREILADGTVLLSDQNGKICWGTEKPERVVLTNDLRSYGKLLHIGQLGWTVIGSTDCYKSIEVEFDTGDRLLVLVYGLTCVDPERADDVSRNLIERHRNTRFDADPENAERCRREWVKKNYEPYLSIDAMTELGVGSQELYAYTFPSLQHLALMKGQSIFPVKIGYTTNEDDGAFGRIRQQIVERAAYPEKPSVLLKACTWNGRQLESAVHKYLRNLERKVASSLGSEWYLTNRDELIEIIAKCPIPERDAIKPILGGSETIEEGFSEVLSRGDRVVFQMDRSSACIQIGFERPDKDMGSG